MTHSRSHPRAHARGAGPPLLAAAAVVATGLALGGRALRQPAVQDQGAAATVWAAGESLKVRPETAPAAKSSTWDAATREVRLYGARQEYVGFQVVVRAGEASLDGVEVRLSPLRSADGKELAAENVDLFLQHYLPVTVRSQFDNATPVPEAETGEFPVQMVPLREPAATRFAASARRNQAVWVDLYVPEDQPPGDYTGEAQVLAGGRPLDTLKVRLTVWPFTLPRETHLKTYLPTGPEKLRWGFGLKPGQDAELKALEDRFFQMAHQHRLNFHPSSGEPAEEEWGERYRGYLDGTAFRTRAGQGVARNLLVLEAGEGTPVEVTAHLKHTLAWWKTQQLPTALACYVYDEPQEDEEFATVAARARAIRAAVGPELPLFLTTMRPTKVPDGLIDVWGEVPAAQIPARQAAGQKFWAVNQGYGGGPYADTPGYAGRTQAWMAWKMGLDGWMFWDSCYWVDRQNLFDAQGKRVSTAQIHAAPERFLTDTWRNPLTFDQKRNPREKDWIRLNGDGVLFYPGTPAGLQEPLASFTMKSLRRGLQDYEYLWLLRQKGKPADDVVRRLVPRPDEWSRDPEAWDAARLELGRRLSTP